MKINEAIKYYQTSDHLIYMTYPVVNDSKLMITIVQNMFKCVKICVGVIVEKEGKSLPESFNSRLDFFKKKCVEKHNINEETLKMVEEIHKIFNECEDSSVEFSRGTNLVICNEGYSNIRAVNISQLKNHLVQLKNLLERAKSI